MEVGSLRVPIRITGHRPVVRTFPVFQDPADARRRQRDAAEASAVETRRRLKAGNLVASATSASDDRGL